MSKLTVEIDPAEAGFDPVRLARIDTQLGAYVDDGRLPGWLVVVSRDGRIAHAGAYGWRDTETAVPVGADTLFRIYSMTKPVTSVAAMMLWEEGAFELDTPVTDFLPAFAEARVFTGGTVEEPRTVPTDRPILMRHLLTHTAGLTYGFIRTHPTDAIYRANGFEWGKPRGFDLAACCDAYARMPLRAQPGSAWNYSVATDVIGRVVEIVSGRPLDAFFAERIFEPLGMVDTGFWVAPGDLDRLAQLYIPHPATRRAVRAVGLAGNPGRRPRKLSGGGGLISSAADYHRFARFLLNRGELDGVRLLGSRTVDYMTRNHLPGGADIATYGNPVTVESAAEGVGFGLGFSVVLDPVATGVPGSPGSYGWAGAASTLFWVDPVERIIVLFFTQLLPSSSYPLRTQLNRLVSAALVD